MAADFVFGLTKKQLIHEVIELRTQLQHVETELSRIREELIESHHRITELHQRDASRYDRLLEKQEEILDSRLGLNRPEVAPREEAPRPIVRRPNFGAIRAEFEKKQREDHWKKVIEVTEARDKAKTAAKPQPATKSSAGEQ